MTELARPASIDRALAELRAELGTPPPPGLAALSAGDIAALTVALRVEKDRSADALDGAADRALRLVPALLRGPVKRVMLR